MCPPPYFQIEYEINPWMHISQRADKRMAIFQWNSLCDVLKQFVNVELIQASPGLPDMCFSANAGVVLDNKTFVRSNFKFVERIGEQDFYSHWFKTHNYEVKTINKDLQFEGEGDLLSAGDLFVMGHGFRTCFDSIEALEKCIGKKIVSLELVDPYFYHLDTCFLPLQDNLVVYYPKAFAPHESDKIEDLFSTIKIGYGDAMNFVCNAVVIGKTIILHSISKRLKSKLLDLGYNTIEIDLSEFHKAGGSAKCLVLKIRD